jgi:hypothetical protein
MYLHWGWSVALLGGVFALYWFVIRPKAPFLEVARNVEGFWHRLFARLHAFRTYVAGVIASVAVSLPDILVKLAPFDFSPLIGQEWALKVAAALGVYVVINRAMSTTPAEKL